MSKFYDQLFILVQTIISYIELCFWWAVGSNHSHAYEESAHACKVWLRHRSEEDMEYSNKSNFIYTHERFSHPNIILEDNISLYTVSTSEAIFVDCGNIDVFDSSKNAFVYNTQFENAVKIIILPIESFHQIASEVSLPKIPIIHLANHGRCGSTLLSKLFEAIPNTLSISETNPFTALAELSRKGHVATNTLQELCFSTVMCTLKHVNARKSELLFFKCQSMAIYITDLLMDAVPSIKHVYMYRQPVPFVRSYEKLYAVNGWKPITVKTLKPFCGMGHSKVLQGTPYYPSYCLESLNNFTKMGLVWIMATAAFNNLVKRGYSIKSLKYEDLVENPRKVLLSLFDFADIPRCMLPDIDKVMSKDSQAGNVYSTRSVDKKILESAYTEISDSLKEEIDTVCGDFQVPLFWNKFHLMEKI